MELTKEEKHTPVIEVSWNSIKITVPSHPPQSPEHYISNITLLRWEEVLISKDLTPEDAPILETQLDDTSDLHATEVCNIHGTWNDLGKMIAPPGA